MGSNGDVTFKPLFLPNEPCGDKRSFLPCDSDVVGKSYRYFGLLLVFNSLTPSGNVTENSRAEGNLSLAILRSLAPYVNVLPVCTPSFCLLILEVKAKFELLPSPAVHVAKI